VDVSGLRFTDKARTSLAFVSLAAHGERSFMFYRHPAADMLMTPADVALDVIENAKIFHFGSITMIHEPSRSATLAAVQHAQAKGLLISYDPNLRLALWDSADAAREGMRIGLEYAHILKVSEEELEFLTGGSDARSLWHTNTQMIVVTRGENGASLYTADAEYHQDGFKVTAVDTTGAGDGFVAGLLTQIVEHQAQHPGEFPPIQAALRFACAVGALATIAKGAIPALPARAQVEAFLAGQA
jgi:fructokinase